MLNRGYIWYEINGLNFNKFLQALKKNNVCISELVKKEYNLFVVKILFKNNKKFLEIASTFHYNIREVKRSFYPHLINCFKKNLVFLLIGIFFLISIIWCNNYVFKVEIYGLTTISEDNVKTVLNQNGFELYKKKENYNLSGIEKILQNNIFNISYASAIIKGNTLIININEKIDNSDKIYDYKPIISPTNLIIEDVYLVSGTLNKLKGDSVKRGDVIIFPRVALDDSSFLKVPAKAHIIGSFQEIVKNECKEADFIKDEKNFIELNKKKLYNNILKDYKIYNIKESIRTIRKNGNITIESTFNGIIEI